MLLVEIGIVRNKLSALMTLFMQALEREVKNLHKRNNIRLKLLRTM